MFAGKEFIGAELTGGDFVGWKIEKWYELIEYKYHGASADFDSNKTELAGYFPSRDLAIDYQPNYASINKVAVLVKDGKGYVLESGYFHSEKSVLDEKVKKARSKLSEDERDLLGIP